MSVKVMIVDDQPLIRDGLKTVLGLEESIEVVCVASNGEEAVEIARRELPDVILLDIRMPGMNGVECLKNIKKNNEKIKIIILTTFNDDEYIISALASGASGYLLKDIEVHMIVEAIHDAMEGKMIMPPTVAKKLAEGLSRINVVKEESELWINIFSDREKEIAEMMVRGFSNKQISSALYISEGTVRNYISGIYEKIGISDRVKAVIYLKEKGTR